MNPRLFLLNLRRGLLPALGLLLLAVAGFVHLGASTPDSVGVGLEGRGALLRGLRRSDQWVGLLCVLLPAALLLTSRIWRRLEQRERSWLLASPTSRLSLSVSNWCGAWSASLVWLLFAGMLCEVSARSVGAGAEWRLQDSLSMNDVEREGAAGRLHWTSPVPAAEHDGRVRFSVGLYGLDNQADEFVLTSFDANGESFDAVTVQPALRSHMEVAVPAAGGALEFAFEARGAQRSVLLNRPRLELFRRATSWHATLAVFIRIALLLAAAQALVIGLCSWFSAPTALLYVVGSYVVMWLESERLIQSAVADWIPALDLPEALDWLAAGKAPAHAPLESFFGALLLVALGLALSQRSLARWRLGR